MTFLPQGCQQKGDAAQTDPGISKKCDVTIELLKKRDITIELVKKTLCNHRISKKHDVTIGLVKT